MRILQICSAKEIGGGERHVIDLANALSERGHSVAAALRTASPLITELTHLRTENILERKLAGPTGSAAAFALAQYVRRNSIDIIHSHAARDYPVAALTSLLSGGTPFVLTRHVLFPMKRIHRFLLGRAACVIAVSEAVRQSILHQDIFPPDRVRTIHNGIDLRRFRGKDVRKRAERPRLKIGIVGHISPIKGQDVFVRAAGIVAAARPDVDFIIVGQDKSRSGENQAEIDAMISELNLSDRIQMEGWTDDVPAVLNELDVFVSCSRSEPFGLAIVEAMACGVPVIASASEGAREIVEDNVTGRLVPLEDHAAMAEAILILINDRAGSRRLAERALGTVYERFSLDSMVRQVEEIYAGILEG